MTRTLDISLLACPTLTEAARLLGVSACTLSRRDDVVVERMGERDKRIPAGKVMRLAVVYRKRSLGEVAADLIARARESSPEHAEHVQEEVERFFEQRECRAGSASELCAGFKAGFVDRGCVVPGLSTGRARGSVPDQIAAFSDRQFHAVADD